jgi:hypothetical protein
MSRIRVSLLLTLSACSVYADDQPRKPTTTDPPRETIAALAGEYYHGDGLGMNMRLEIMPDGRFSFTWRGCLGLYAASDGRAKLVNGRLILKPENPSREDQFGVATEYIPVRWGKRRYLISRDQMKSFCNDVNLGSEPRRGLHGLFYLRVGDQAQKVTGRPNVPRDWEAFLLKAPVRAKVIKVLADGSAQVDCGVESGVCKGMALYTDTSIRVEVIEVEPKTAVIQVTPSRGLIKIGQQVHSRVVRDD